MGTIIIQTTIPMLLHVILIKLISSQKREEQARKQEEISEGWMEVREVVRGKYDKKKHCTHV